MYTSDWLNLIAAILVGGGTLFLGIMAWRNIRQTRNIQKAEKRERLLNEIIEWAIDVSNKRSESKKIFKEMAGITDTKQQEIFTYAHIVEVKESYVGMSGKNRYIENITPESEHGLRDAVVKLIDDLEAYIELLVEWGRVKADAIAHNVIKEEEYIAREGEYTARADEHVLQLEVSTSKVIEEAVKIKTRDIGKKEENMSKEGEATVSKEPTLKDIEKHLKKQDRQMARGSYLTGAAVGAAVILVAVSLWIGRTVLPIYDFYWTYIFLLACGFGFMFWCWYKQAKIKG